jgi:hypothetical protein
VIQAGLGKKQDNQSEKGWQRGSSGRAPALQVWDPVFKTPIIPHHTHKIKITTDKLRVYDYLELRFWKAENNFAGLGM